MPPHHLTTAPPYQLATGVLTLLAGADLDTTATDIGVDPADLAEAAMVYQAAGLAALERRAEADWYQVRVEFPDWSNPETVGATRLGPLLDQLQACGAVSGWWFLRKHPCWRLRLHRADTAAVDQVLNELTADGALARWWPTVYEPETAAFGGPVGMQAAHDLFCADSRGVLDYVRQSAPGLGRRELSLLLVSALQRAADMDEFECGDVFARVAQLRPTPAGADAARVDHLADSVHALLAIPVQAGSGPFAPGEAAAFAAPWLTAWQAAGRAFGHAAAEGRLDRGLRALLTHLLIFHWNRLGLSATAQGILARAATAALLPGS
ncbi:thiopeptide-type bacteriocin biosynthesis protein [[Actinomadura] parvosata]|uniref:thiopeptide-type bacteriocin biosynthesis protein n=1 Tax=[Actinomadura] parvosata TaxID=1955412 RepID=UPI00406C73C5